jgi:hypothetical protein
MLYESILSNGKWDSERIKAAMAFGVIILDSTFCPGKFNENYNENFVEK